MCKTNFKAAIWKEGEKYVSQCLNVEVASFGTTKKEALLKLQEAVELYFEEIKTPKFTRVERPDVVSFKLQYA